MLSKTRRILRRILDLFLAALALLWRSLLFRTTFIVITGSVGKTTAKECLAAILSTQGRTVKTIGNANGRHGLPRTILRATPWHRYVVLEAGTDRPGHMIRSALLIRPDIAVVLSVAATHTQEFRTLEDTAAEKAKILRFLPRRGLAVLNNDDPRVATMAPRVRCQVIRFGNSPGSDIRAEHASSVWPMRLRFQVATSTESHEVRTRLVGTHWAPSVLAALAAAKACGVNLATAASALHDVEPFPGRMQPVKLPSGATLLRDDHNGSIHTLGPALLILRQANTERKVLVISDCSDSGKNYRQRLKYVALEAAKAADVVVFIGPKSGFAAKRAVEAGVNAGNVHQFTFAQEAVEFVRTQVHAGDLVLLKGRLSDHLGRIYFAQFEPVACWLPTCSKRGICDLCPKLRATAR